MRSLNEIYEEFRKAQVIITDGLDDLMLIVDNMGTCEKCLKVWSMDDLDDTFHCWDCGKIKIQPGKVELDIFVTDELCNVYEDFPNVEDKISKWLDEKKGFYPRKGRGRPRLADSKLKRPRVYKKKF